jgi:hypothetical protein
LNHHGAPTKVELWMGTAAKGATPALP